MHPLETRMSEINEEIWSDFLGFHYQTAQELEQQDPNPVISIVHIHGDWNGAIIVVCSQEAIKSAAQTMYGKEYTIRQEECEDVAREIANMLGGHIKTFISEAQTETPCVLSPPEILTLMDFENCLSRASEKYMVSFLSAGEHSNQTYLIKL